MIEIIAYALNVAVKSDHSGIIKEDRAIHIGELVGLSWAS
jgi:hypothetical protein